MIDFNDVSFIHQINANVPFWGGRGERGKQVGGGSQSAERGEKRVFI